MRGKRKFYSMPYIEDKDVFRAVTFALKLKQTMTIGLAIHKAAKYYGVSQGEVARYVGMIGGRKAAKKNIYDNLDAGRDEGLSDD